MTKLRLHQKLLEVFQTASSFQGTLSLAKNQMVASLTATAAQVTATPAAAIMTPTWLTSTLITWMTKIQVQSHTKRLRTKSTQKMPTNSVLKLKTINQMILMKLKHLVEFVNTYPKEMESSWLCQLTLRKYMTQIIQSVCQIRNLTLISNFR